MAGPLVDLKQTHAHLLQDCNCVEAAPAAKAADADADNAEAPAAAHLSLPPLNMLARQHLLSEEEIVAGCSPPSARCKHLMRMLHSKVTVNTISRVPEGEPGHSILQHDMPDNEEPDGEEAR